MIESERQQIIELIKKEVIPAIGCTEPIAVALCVAKAAETLGVKPEKIEVLLSANILKNAMGKYNISIVFTSSLEGDHFNGAIGSTLLIDEAELIYRSNLDH